MRIVALVPAAGQSRRMGRPKLTLGLGKESVIQRVVAALDRGGADAVLVMAPPASEPGAVVLANHARVEGAEVVHLAEPTPDMRATIERGLDALLEHGLAPADGLLLTPGDLPGLTPDLVRQVLARFRAEPTRIVVPVHGEKRGHPIALPWAIAQEIHGLPAGVGVDHLVAAHAAEISTVPIPDVAAMQDIDTPDDYRAWTKRPPS